METIDLSLALTFTLSKVLENLIFGLFVQADYEILAGNKIIIKEFEGN